jgi:hypothetical protein
MCSVMESADGRSQFAALGDGSGLWLTWLSSVGRGIAAPPTRWGSGVVAVCSGRSAERRRRRRDDARIAPRRRALAATDDRALAGVRSRWSRQPTAAQRPARRRTRRSGVVREARGSPARKSLAATEQPTPYWRSTCSSGTGRPATPEPSRPPALRLRATDQRRERCTRRRLWRPGRRSAARASGPGREPGPARSR